MAHPHPPLTVAPLAEHKRLPLEFLSGLGQSGRRAHSPPRRPWPRPVAAGPSRRGDRRQEVPTHPRPGRQAQEEARRLLTVRLIKPLEALDKPPTPPPPDNRPPRVA